jgi:hypothetical protein
MESFIASDERQYVKQILSEEEQLLIAQLADNPATLEAIKKVILLPIYQNGTLQPDQPSEPMRNFLLSVANRRDTEDAVLGQQLRSAADACILVETGINMLRTFIIPKEKVAPTENPAR